MRKEAADGFGAGEMAEWESGALFSFRRYDGSHLPLRAFGFCRVRDLALVWRRESGAAKEKGSRTHGFVFRRHLFGSFVSDWKSVESPAAFH